MKAADRQTRSYLMELFEQHGFHPRTDLGQNFLIDLNIIDYIVDQARLEPNDVVLEVGAGTGGMTGFLAQQAAAVVSVEIDSNMYGLAKRTTARYDNVCLLHIDALKTKNRLSPELLEAVEEKLAEAPDRRLKLVANLPYSVATPVVSNLVATDLPWKQMVITIQEELGLRMASRPGRKDYGALSVWLQAQCRVKILKRVGPNVFWPRPKVNSAIVRLVPDVNRQQTIHDRAFFHDFVRRLFQQRRKLMRSVIVGMYRKQLSKLDIDTILADANLADRLRAEQINVRGLIDLSNRIGAAIGADVSG